jgi:hypothetical protein
MNLFLHLSTSMKMYGRMEVVSFMLRPIYASGLEPPMPIGYEADAGGGRQNRSGRSGEEKIPALVVTN